MPPDAVDWSCPLHAAASQRPCASGPPPLRATLRRVCRPDPSALRDGRREPGLRSPLAAPTCMETRSSAAVRRCHWGDLAAAVRALLRQNHPPRPNYRDAGSARIRPVATCLDRVHPRIRPAPETPLLAFRYGVAEAGDCRGRRLGVDARLASTAESSPEQDSAKRGYQRRVLESGGRKTVGLIPLSWDLLDREAPG